MEDTIVIQLLRSRVSFDEDANNVKAIRTLKGAG